MTEPDDSPLPKFRKKCVPQQPQSLTPESPVNHVIKRPTVGRTPPEPARSSRDTFLSHKLLDHEAKEVGSDGVTNSSVSDYSSDDEDADDSCVTHGSHPDGSFEVYQQGQSSQADNFGFSTPLQVARHSGRVPLHQELEDRLIAEKAARKSARLAAEAVAATASLLAIPIPDMRNVAPNQPAVDQSVPLAGSAAAFDLPQRKITIPLMFQRSRQEILPVPPQPVAKSPPRTPVLSPVKVSLPLSPLPDLLSFASRIIPETPVPKLPPSMPSLQPSSGPPRQQSRMKLSTLVRSISVQTMPVTRVATASIAVQTQESDADLPVTLRDLRSELQSFLKGIGV
jgi:hypothetical protein